MYGFEHESFPGDRRFEIACKALIVGGALAWLICALLLIWS